MPTEHWLAVVGVLGPVAAVLIGLHLTRIAHFVTAVVLYRHEKQCREELNAVAGRRHHPERMEDYDGPY